MKNKLILLLLLIMLSISCNNSEPYSEGYHWTYEITCEGGFVYKTFDRRRGTIIILNSDGTPLRCGEERY